MVCHNFSFERAYKEAGWARVPFSQDKCLPTDTSLGSTDDCLRPTALQRLFNQHYTSDNTYKLQILTIAGTSERKSQDSIPKGSFPFEMGFIIPL